MQPILEYLKQREKQSYDDKLPDGVDLSKYSWPRYGISDTEMGRCIESVRKYAYEHYFKELGIKDYMEEILKDTYKEYELTNGCDEKEAERRLKRILNVINHYGFGQAEYAEIGQGWWHFVDWLIEQRLN